MLGDIIGGLGSIFGASKEEKSAERNIKFQKQFAQEGIQWRVNDAKAAGIHPLAALGASTPSFQPVQSAAGDLISQGASNLGQAVSNRGNQRMAQERHQAELAVLKSEAALNNANMASMLRESQSRTMHQAARNAAIGGPGTLRMMQPPAARPYTALRVLGTKESFNIPTDVAQQFDLGNGDTVSHGLMEELIGDVASEMLAPSLVTGFENFSRDHGGTGIIRDAKNGRPRGPSAPRPTTGPRRSTTSIPQNLRYR